MHTFVRCGAYPGAMTLGIAIHLGLLSRGVDILLASYLPVVLGALLVTLLEWRFPYRRAWAPTGREVAQDSIFMVLIQVILPKGLSFAIAIALVRYLQTHQLATEGWWPAQWPAPVQTLAMVVVADGLRYWLHRASHEWEPLWRFHAVHHSPHRLYWLNVGRFHPVDKALQFLLDSAPFIFLGVGEEVLGLYFVCYAVNGFFQHCNIDVRLGMLNYLISGPELHRWHHSMWKQESNHNYGNNLIVWDLVFRTWYLPDDKEVGELGLLNRHYPGSFTKQMATPFIAGLDKQAA